MGKKKKLIIIAVVLLVGITLTIFMIPKIKDMLYERRMASIYDSVDELSEELSGMSTEEIIDDMNTVLNEGNEHDSVTYHAMSLSQRLDKIEGDFLLSAAENKLLHPTVRYTMIELYGEKLGNDADPEKLLKIISDEDEDTTLRAHAIYVLPSDDIQVQEILASLFFTIDESELAHDCLKFLWNSNGDIAEPVADKVLADHLSYSPERVCAAIVCKRYLIEENTAERSFDVLMAEKDKFADICIEIYETYEKPASYDRGEYNAAYDPVRISMRSMAQIGSEKSARYILDEDGFISDNKLESEITESACRAAVQANYPALIKLAKTSDKEEDIDLLFTAVKYISYKDIVDEMQEKIDNGEIKDRQIVLPPDFDGRYRLIETDHASVVSWEIMR